MPTLFDQLTELLSRQSLTWESEASFPIEAVRLPFWKVWGWQRVGRGLPLLLQQSQMDIEPDYWYKLDELLQRCETIAYRKPTGEPCQYHLLIVVRNKLWLEGIATKLVET